MRIKLPRDISKLKIAHIFEIMKIERETEQHSVNSMVNHVSLFSGTPRADLLKADIGDIQRAYAHCLSVINTYEPKKPVKTVKVKGKEYVFTPTIKQTGGWYIDVKANAEEFLESPELVPAFMYIEKGMKYSQTDKDKNILNPLRARAEIFRDHFPADVFLDLNGFFLQRCEVLTKGFLILNKERAEEIAQRMSREVL